MALIGDPERIKKRILLSIGLLILVLISGTFGYAIIDGWSLFDSFYMTIITLATIGYTEVHALSKWGRVFNIFLIFFGVGVVAYNVNNGIRFIFEGELRTALGRKKLEKRMKGLRNHFIICGYGRMGRIICNQLKSKKVPFIVIEKESFDVDPDDDTLYFFGDATKDDILKETGIDRARGLVAVLSTDAQNLFVVLSARGLNPDLRIVARALEEGSETKLLRAGADRVISPYYIGGMRMASAILKPAVVDFIEIAMLRGDIDLQMEEIMVEEGSRFAGLTIAKTKIGRELGIIIVAIKRAEGEMQFNPTYKTIIHPGDTLIALGEVNKLARLELLAKK